MHPFVRIAAIPLLLAGGCVGEDGPSTPATSGTCPDAGVVGCPCIDGGLCVGGAVCEDGVCVPEDGGDTGGTTGTKTPPDVGGDTGGTTGGPTGSCAGRCGSPDAPCACDPVCVEYGDCCPDYETACPGQCIGNDECAPDEVCSSGTQTCVPAYGHTYGIVVSYWFDGTDKCWDFGACASPDPFYYINYCGGTVFTSVTKKNTIEASWSTEAEITVTNDCVFSLTMKDEDISAHDWILTWCEKNASDQCWVLPEDLLHAGVWSGTWSGAGNGDYELEIRFRPL